jgi:putative iron-regulated protein
VGGEENVATGWHAIEFLLWGQDRDTAGPGARPVTDYTTALNADRRGLYLSTVTQMLIDDLTEVRDEWLSTGGGFRSAFLAQNVETSIERILTGVATLGVGELRGERILVPFDSKSQEDEHSCFSDSTHLDHIHDGIGIRNVWLGEYDAFDDAYDFDGTGMDEVFERGTPTLGAAVGDAIDDAVLALEAQESPFDQAILGADTTPGRVALQACLDRLNDFNIAISNAAADLDLSITSF